MTLTPVSPLKAQGLLGEGARLVDIRSAQEFAQGSAAGAQNHPLGSGNAIVSEKPVIFLCRTGLRTEMNASELAALCSAPAYRIEGGFEAWKQANLPVASEVDGQTPLEGMGLGVTGAIALLTILLGWMYSALWLVIPAAIAADMVYAGSKGTSMIAKALAKIGGMVSR